MLFFFLIFGSVCLFLGGIFFLVFRRSRARHETLSRTLTAEAWAKLHPRDAGQACQNPL